MLHGRVPGAVVPGCWLQGLVAAEDLQDFAQLLRVGSFQVQMVSEETAALGSLYFPPSLWDLPA